MAARSLKKIKALFIDDTDFEIQGMREIFDYPELTQLYDFQCKHFPMNPGNGSLRPDEQKEKILHWLKTQWDNTDILIIDMDLIGNPSYKPPISLQIINNILENDTYRARFDKQDIKIIFVTGYSEKKDLLTGDRDLWREGFFCRDKPKFSSLTSRVPEGCCPEVQGRACKRETHCLRTVCFMEYLLMIAKGELKNE